MLAKDIRELSEADINARIAELERERFNLRIQSGTRTLDDPLRFRVIRRDVARLKTVLKEKVIGIIASGTREGGSAYFAPLVTNASEEMLRIRVNAGLEGGVDCGCAIRPGAKRVFVGYYRLYRNSTVQARDSTGRTATFREVGPQVTAADGTVGLRFETKDFR